MHATFYLDKFYSAIFSPGLSKSFLYKLLYNVFFKQVNFLPFPPFGLFWYVIKAFDFLALLSWFEKKMLLSENINIMPINSACWENFHVFLASNVFSESTFSKNSFRITIKKPSSLDPDQCSVHLDLGPNCLQLGYQHMRKKSPL